jgi:hypothetical protein
MSPTSRWKGKMGIIKKYYSRSGWYSMCVNGVSPRFKGKNLKRMDTSNARVRHHDRGTPLTNRHHGRTHTTP